MANVFNIKLISKVEQKKITFKDAFSALWKSLLSKGSTLFILQTFHKLEKDITNNCCNLGINNCKHCLKSFLESFGDIRIVIRKYAFITTSNPDRPKILMSISLFKYKDMNLHANIEYCSKELLEFFFNNNSFRHITRSSYGTLLKYDDFEYNDIFNIFIHKNEFIYMLLHYYVCSKLCYIENTNKLFQNYLEYLKNDKKYKFTDNLFNLIRSNRDIFLNSSFRNAFNMPQLF